MPAGQRYSWDEHARRCALILADGQKGVLSLEWLGDLLALTIRPSPEWLHLVVDPDECEAEYGPYHVSIAQRELVTQGDEEVLRKRWDGAEVVLQMHSISSYSGYQELAYNDPVCADDVIQRLHFHPDAWYRGRALHVSG